MGGVPQALRKGARQGGAVQANFLDCCLSMLCGWAAGAEREHNTHTPQSVVNLKETHRSSVIVANCRSVAAAAASQRRKKTEEDKTKKKKIYIKKTSKGNRDPLNHTFFQ